MEACLLNATASPYPFMHIFHGSWLATIPDPPVNFKEGDLILDVGANVGEQTVRLASAHPRSRIHAYEILPVPTREEGARDSGTIVYIYIGSIAASPAFKLFC